MPDPAPPSPPLKLGWIAYSMRALGRDDLPPTISLNDETFSLHTPIKHDFWAVTGFYQSQADQRLVVLKVGRTTPFAGVPLRWLGRRLRDREVWFYNRLADLPNVPRMLGLLGPTGFVHAYVPGRPLSKHHPVPDTFFAELMSLLAELHRRDIAYVDTNKPENILLGSDSHPHLIDFQISFALDPNKGFLSHNPLTRWWLRRLQRADVYHILKHKKRLRRDQLTDDELQIVTNRGLLIHLHRIVTKPYFFVRRRLFKYLRDTGRILPEGSK